MVQSNSLIGQAIIGGLSNKQSLDRISHYQKYVRYNAASNACFGPHSPEHLSKVFGKYRRNWFDQPQNWSSDIKSQKTNLYDGYTPLSIEIGRAHV